MKFVKAAPTSSGAYQGPRSVPFPGCLPLTDGQAETLVAYNGFVTITREPDPEIEGSSVTVTPDLEAWEAWTAAQPAEPEPEPSLDERVDGIEAAVQYAVCICNLLICPKVLHQLIRLQDIGTDLVAPCDILDLATDVRKLLGVFFLL